jgi:FkbM family methyltransferase
MSRTETTPAGLSQQIVFDGEQPYVDRAAELDVFNCFRLILGRLPKREEWTGHSLAAGQPLEAVVRSFVNSLEFTNRGFLAARRLDDVELVALDRFRMYVSRSDMAVGHEILQTRAYEPHVTTELCRLLAPGKTFIDVGANIGFFSLLAAALVGPSGRCIAVEPNPRNVKLLAASVAANGYTNIQICQAAATEAPTLLYLNTNHSNGVVSDAGSELEQAMAREIVQGLRLDDVFPALHRVDVIKLDIEGAEYRAMLGLQRILDAHRPAILTEFSPPAIQAISGVGAAQYLEMFVARGYEVTVLRRDARTPLGTDTAAVLDAFAVAATDHVDLCLEPRAAA